MATSDDQNLTRRSSARRKAKTGEPKKQKQPRRGMGVAKLEKLRLQDPAPPVVEMNALYAAHDFGQIGMDRNVNPVGFPGFYVPNPLRLLHNHEPDFFGKNVDAAKCSSLHCNACHKKKKINDDRLFLGLDLGENFDVEAKPPLTLGNYGNKVEVVAVHRKGATTAWNGGSGGVLMEYDFFPTANVDGGGGEEESKAVGVYSDESKCVDLSLKLSNY